jgi:hypothetical protein
LAGVGGVAGVGGAATTTTTTTAAAAAAAPAAAQHPAAWPVAERLELLAALIELALSSGRVRCYAEAQADLRRAAMREASALNGELRRRTKEAAEARRREAKAAKAAKAAAREECCFSSLKTNPKP